MPIEWYDINNKKTSLAQLYKKRGNCGCLTGTLNF